MSRSRNRPATEHRLRSAAAALLREEGFTAYGLNAVARRAGTDKVLIYRYFSSAEGLLSAVLQDLQLWPDPADLPADPRAFLTDSLHRLQQDPLPLAFLGAAAGQSLRSAARRQFNDQLATWVRGLRDRTSGPWPDPEFMDGFTARVLQSAVLPGSVPLSGHTLWLQLTPPLLPAESESPPAESGDLPPELL